MRPWKVTYNLNGCRDEIIGCFFVPYVIIFANYYLLYKMFILNLIYSLDNNLSTREGNQTRKNYSTDILSTIFYVRTLTVKQQKKNMMN